MFFLGTYLLINSNQQKISKKKFKIHFRIIFGLISGFISAPMGIGGAVMNVPILKYFGYPIKKAIASTFLNLGNDAGAQKFLANLKSSKFVKMTDKDYDVIRTLAKAKAEFKKKNKK